LDKGHDISFINLPFRYWLVRLSLLSYIKTNETKKKNDRCATDINREKLSVIYFSMLSNYDPYEIKLANEISETLHDRDSMALHLMYVRRYQEDFLRRILNKVMALPERKIRKSRAALYTFLINQSTQHGDSRH
jgi:hypothetical protein